MFTFTTPKRPFTGMDKLIIAAMMEESASSNRSFVASANRSFSNSSMVSTGTFHQARPLATPTSTSELELYRLLERANLLKYFNTFLEYGGDDVQQLSDADEDEFLEIMCLVGMNQKPLHIRRLQKALVEWRDTREAEINYKQSHRNHDPADNEPRRVQPIGQANDGPHQASTCSMMHCDPASSRLAPTQTDEHSPQKYCNPREIIINAPKRPRLMDDLHRKRSDLSPFRQSLYYEDESNQTSTGRANPSTVSPGGDRARLDREDDSYVDVIDDDSASEQSDADADETHDSLILEASTGNAMNLSDKHTA